MPVNVTGLVMCVAVIDGNICSLIPGKGLTALMGILSSMSAVLLGIPIDLGK